MLGFRAQKVFTDEMREQKVWRPLLQTTNSEVT